MTTPNSRSSRSKSNSGQPRKRRAPSTAAQPVFAGALSADLDDFAPVAQRVEEEPGDEAAAPRRDAYDAVFEEAYDSPAEPRASLAAADEGDEIPVSDDEDDGPIEVDPTLEGRLTSRYVELEDDVDSVHPVTAVQTVEDAAPPEWAVQDQEKPKFDAYYNPRVPGENFRIAGTRALGHFQAGRFVPRNHDEESSVQAALRGYGRDKPKRWRGDDMKRARQCSKCGFTTKNSDAWDDHVNYRLHG